MISDIVFYLLKKGAHKEPRRITTSEIAAHIGLSQQTASRKLIQLERDGHIERSGGKVRLTEKSLSSIRFMIKAAIDALEGTSLSFSADVVSGLGEGAYYLSQKEYISQFTRKLGFKPFPGTLNVMIAPEELEKRIVLRQRKPIAISGFRKDKRTFGHIDAYRCAIDGLACAIVFPDRSLHGLRVLEVISEFNLRKKLGLQDGSNLQIEIVEN